MVANAADFSLRLNRRSRMLSVFIAPVKFILDCVRYNDITDRKFIEQRFYYTFGYRPDLDAPKTFSEKIQWIKLNERGAVRTICADKYAVREYVKARIGGAHLIPLVFHTKNVVELKPDVLPDFPVIVKTNHASGKVYIIRNLQDTNFIEMQEELDRQLGKNFYHSLREWHYKNITPRVLVEKLLLNEKGEIPEDYKIHCFNGVPKFIQVDSNRFNQHVRSIYDLSWNKLNVEIGCPLNTNDLPCPQSIDDMITIAKTLSSDFDYVRVDLYDVKGTVYFGELTFTPTSGFKKFNPPSEDKAWGDLICLKSRGNT